MSRSLFLLLFAMACSEVGPMDGARKVSSEAVEQQAKGQDAATGDLSTDKEGAEPAKDTAKPAGEFAPVTSAALTCAADYVGLPATESMPRYGCRVALADNRRVDIPSGVNVELNFFAGATPISVTPTPAPANSLWQWYVRTDAKGPLTAQVLLRNAEITADAVPAVKTGSKKYASDKVAVEGSSLQLVVNGGIANAVGDGNAYRTTIRPLAFTGTFPKYMTVNRPTGLPTQMYAGFLVGTNRLTCRYNLVPDLTTYYMIDAKTCRRGTVDFEPADVPNPPPPPYDTDLSNPAVKWSLDDLVVGATQWYTDWVITPGDVARLQPPVGVVTNASIREFKVP